METSGTGLVLLYLLCAAETLIVARRVLRASDRTSIQALPPVPGAPDPIEMAYLAGGENNVIRTVLYGLIHRGFVDLGADRRLRLGRAAAASGDVSELEAHVLVAVQSGLACKDIFANAPLRAAVQSACARLRAQLTDQELLRPQSVSEAGTAVWRTGLSVLIGCSLLLVAVRGFRVDATLWGIQILMLLACAFLRAIVSSRSSARLSKRGRAYIAKLRLAYPSRADNQTAHFDGFALFLIGLYGLDHLSGTSDEHIAKALGSGQRPEGGACGVSASGYGDDVGDGGAGSCGGGGCGGGDGGGGGGGGG
jgi:uncharacterized protein (TIGR04222 family)